MCGYFNYFFDKFVVMAETMFSYPLLQLFLLLCTLIGIISYFATIKTPKGLLSFEFTVSSLIFLLLLHYYNIVWPFNKVIRFL